ncbi:hypothetical protein [Ectobacillus panaciterrae]|uniref:hypothetical protein n=1 Tax=Ectobacillus panaciterrae TaxID=363872 RepID=UPI000413AAC3|nr:hypothetical protein [Ectobacillus panaciterrae]
MDKKELVSRLVAIEGMFKAGRDLSFQELQMLIADAAGIPMDTTFQLVDRYGQAALENDDYFSREFVMELFEKFHNGGLSEEELVELLINWDKHDVNTKGGIYFDMKKYLSELSTSE